jgi:hypothetical protein
VNRLGRLQPESRKTTGLHLLVIDLALGLLKHLRWEISGPSYVSTPLNQYIRSGGVVRFWTTSLQIGAAPGAA